MRSILDCIYYYKKFREELKEPEFHTVEIFRIKERTGWSLDMSWAVANYYQVIFSKKLNKYI